MIELNLLPDIKLQYVRAQKARRRVISVVSIGGIVSLGLVAVFAIYVYAVQPLRGGIYDANIKKNSKTLAQNTDLNNLLTIQQQLKELPALHAAKPVYSRMVGYLTVLNPSAPNSMHVTQLAVDSTTDTNAMTLQAYAPSYTSVTVYESTLKSAQFSYSKDGVAQDSIPLFTSVKMTNTAIGQDSNGNKVVTFTVELEVDPAVFAFTSTNPSISVPSKNATNSATNVPSVFAETAIGGN